MGDTEDTEFEDNLAARATELFKLCDHDSKGYITEEDLVLVSEELGLPLTHEQITLTFAKLDKDQNNYLTLAEFISGFGLFLGANDTEDKFEPVEYSQAHQLFDLCDREKKGYIIKSDLERLAGEFGITEQELGDLFHSLDQDANGYLTLEEFVNGFSLFLAFETNNEAHEDGEQIQSPGERIYESYAESAANSPGISEDVIFDRIANRVGDDLLSGMLHKGQLHGLWKALSSNEAVGFQKLTEFLTEVSQEIKRSRTQALTLEKTLKGKVEAHEMEILKLYEKMDTQVKNERQNISSHHEKREKEISEQFQNEMELKEKELQELLNQQKELEKKIVNLNKVDMDVRDENNKLLQTNFDLQNKLDESSSSLEDTKSYVQHLQSLTLEEKKEKARQTSNSEVLR